MCQLLRICAVAACLLIATPAGQAGLYYSGEEIAELPAQWRGFLLDQRQLRLAAVKPSGQQAATPLRQRYEGAAAHLEKASRERPLSADEKADLGALYLRLGETGKALTVLQAGQRAHPHHFRLVANLGTAWQLQGNLDQAALALQEGVRLAPLIYQKSEEAQLRLVRQRRQQGRDRQGLDDLFGVRYVGESGVLEPGKLAAAEKKKLPSDAAAVAQRLALSLPADGYLLWQLAELANAHGDVRTAAAMLDGCVSEFGLNSPELRRRRQILRAAADDLARAGHDVHADTLRARSKRPLPVKNDPAALPPIDAQGVNVLPWAVLAETTRDAQLRATFARYLRDLDGKQVALSGFVQPLGDSLDLASFLLLEYPVGCWYCEMPEVTGIVLAELPPGQTTKYARGLLKVTGTLHLNAQDPESFLYTIKKAKVAEAD